MTLRVSAAVAAIMIACGFPAMAGERPDRAADIETLRIAKVETWRALYYEQDADGLDAFLTDDFILIDGAGGVTPKAEEVEWLRNNAWNGPADFLYTVEDIVFQGDDVAVVYGHGDSTRTDENGEACKHTYKSSNVFRREDGEWRAAFSHVSGARCDSIDG